MNDHPRLGAEGLRLAYGPRVIVPGLDLDVPPAAFTVLLGPNGSGKSTVLRALAGLLRPVAGRVVLDGRPLPQFSPRRLARRIGLLPQAPLAPEGTTVEALVGLGRHPHRGFLAPWSAADAAACARAMATTRTADLAGRGLDTLSGGQRQRAWIAMALAQETPILLLDEPTTFLDLAHQIEILSLLRDLVRAGRTVVAVLHDLQLAARYADHLVLLAAGRIAARGTPKAVLTAAQVEAVFGLRVRVIPDPETGRPLCLPRSDQGLRRA